jgi:hypothetical protein
MWKTCDASSPESSQKDEGNLAWESRNRDIKTAIYLFPSYLDDYCFPLLFDYLIVRRSNLFKILTQDLADRWYIDR